MRTVRIDFTAAVLFPDGNYVGVIGEHRATELQITLPDDMTTDIDYWIAVFKSGTRTIESGIITDELSEDGNAIVTDGILCIKLWRKLTLAPCLNLTVSAYKMDGDKAVLIASMPLIGDFYFSAANIEGEPADTEAGGMAVDVATLKADVDGLTADVTALAEDSHTHTNKSLLDTYTQTETDLADAVTKKHTHANKALLDAYDGNSGSVTVVDSYTDLPADAPDGTVVYLTQESMTEVPLDTSKIPYRNEIYDAIRDAYIEQGGTVGDAGWEDFKENYTNCNYPKGSLKLGTPNCYDLEYTGTQQIFGLNYGMAAFFILPLMFAVFSEPQDVDYPYFIPNEPFTCPHVAGVSPSQEYFFDHMEEFVFVENGETRIRMPLTIMYCFENLTGEVFNTDGMLDGIQVTLPKGWTELNLIFNEEFKLLRVETSPAVYPPEFYFWQRTNENASQDTPQDEWLMEAVSAMFNEVVTVEKGLYVKIEGVWKKI